MENAPVEPRGNTAPATTTVDAVSPQPGVMAQSPSQPSKAAPGASGGQSKLPEELIKIPAVTAVLAGKPAAFSGNEKTFTNRDDGKLILKNAPLMTEAGFGFYGSLDGKTGVVFNQFYLTPTEIQQADKAGKLLEVAPPMDQVAKMAEDSGEGDNLAHQGLKSHPGQLKTAPPPNPDQSASAAAQQMKVPGASVSPGKQTARANNLSLGAPSSGPKPGAGRLLNNILKPVV